jgi:photosynthetic reaction center cytochrome c subunit
MRLVVAFSLLAYSIAAQQPPAPAGAKQPPPNPTNLKILKVNSGAEVSQIMRTFTTGLGVQCSFCHVAGNYPSDDNPKKDEARKMIAMVQKINTEFPDGKMHVSCFTCHRGEAQPKTAPEPKQ